MTHLIDTNILLRSCEPDHPMFKLAKDTVKTLLNRGNNLYITPQNLIEFWNVSRDPKIKMVWVILFRKLNQKLSRSK